MIILLIFPRQNEFTTKILEKQFGKYFYTEDDLQIFICPISPFFFSFSLIQNKAKDEIMKGIKEVMGRGQRKTEQPITITVPPRCP